MIAANIEFKITYAVNRFTFSKKWHGVDKAVEHNLGYKIHIIQEEDKFSCI